ncbi:hypothetical protein PALU110988_11905 [Paenibacillus lupini]|nr:4-amino-4-deoxy-L-arabinose transferase-like glycosyltransferase [Paenibacillus lupini]
MGFSITAAIAQFVFVGIPIILLVLYFVRKSQKKRNMKDA